MKHAATAAAVLDTEKKHDPEALPWTGETHVCDFDFDPWVGPECPFADPYGKMSDPVVPLTRGENVQVIKHHGNWIHGRKENGTEGYFPAACIKAVVREEFHAYTPAGNTTPAKLDLTQRPMAEILREYKAEKAAEAERIRKEAADEAARLAAEEAERRRLLAPFEKMMEQCAAPAELPPFFQKKSAECRGLRDEYIGISPPPIPILVNTPHSAKAVAIEIFVADTLETLKQKVEHKIGKPCRDLAVVLQEEVQDTRKTLGDCEIGPNAVVDLVLPKDPQDQAQLKTPLERSQTMVERPVSREQERPNSRGEQ